MLFRDLRRRKSKYATLDISFLSRKECECEKYFFSVQSIVFMLFGSYVVVWSEMLFGAEIYHFDITHIISTNNTPLVNDFYFRTRSTSRCLEC